MGAGVMPAAARSTPSSTISCIESSISNADDFMRALEAKEQEIAELQQMVSELKAKNPATPDAADDEQQPHASWSAKLVADATGVITPTASFDTWLSDELRKLQQVYPNAKQPRRDKRRRNAAKRSGARSHTERVARHAISEAIKAQDVLAQAELASNALEEYKTVNEFGIDAVIAQAASVAKPQPTFRLYGRLPSGFDRVPVEALIAKRASARLKKHYSEADRLQRRIQRMGVKLDDRRRTWSVIKGWKKMQEKLKEEEDSSTAAAAAAKA